MNLTVSELGPFPPSLLAISPLSHLADGSLQSFPLGGISLFVECIHKINLVDSHPIALYLVEENYNSAPFQGKKIPPHRQV